MTQYQCGLLSPLHIVIASSVTLMQRHCFIHHRCRHRHCRAHLRSKFSITQMAGDIRQTFKGDTRVGSKVCKRKSECTRVNGVQERKAGHTASSKDYDNAAVGTAVAVKDRRYSSETSLSASSHRSTPTNLLCVSLKAAVAEC